jgi:hypothetical protein
MEELMSQLVRISHQLVQEHNVSHKQIKNEIYNGLKLLSEQLPKQHVLYNGVYGGYNFAESFLTFIEEKDQDWCLQGQKQRIQLVQKVKDFGSICKQRFSHISKLIAIYNRFKLKKVFDYVWDLKNAQEELPRLTSIYKTVMNTNEECFGTEDDIQYFSTVKFELETILKYKKQTLLQFLLKKTDEAKDVIQNAYNNVNGVVTLETFNTICEDYNIVFEDEKLQDTCKWFEKKNWAERITVKEGMKRFTFADAIEYYGETHFAIWKCQSHYSDRVMRFLVKHHADFNINCLASCTDLEIGLMFASGTYCKLCVGEAPQILSWYISEYDGREKIVVDP